MVAGAAKRLALLAIVVVLAAAGASFATAAALDYEQILTAGAGEGETLPLVIAVHGLGDRPERFVRLLGRIPVRARVVAPRAPLEWKKGFSWYSLPRTSSAASVRTHEVEFARSVAALAQLIRKLQDAYPTCGRPVVVGFSQGGALSFALASDFPELVGAAFPLGGYLPPARRALPAPPAPDGLRVVAFHGEADQRVAIERAESAVRFLADRGFDASLRRFPGVEHRVPARMREALYEALVDYLSGE